MHPTLIAVHHWSPGYEYERSVSRIERTHRCWQVKWFDLIVAKCHGWASPQEFHSQWAQELSEPLRDEIAYNAAKKRIPDSHALGSRTSSLRVLCTRTGTASNLNVSSHAVDLTGWQQSPNQSSHRTHKTQHYLVQPFRLRGTQRRVTSFHRYLAPTSTVTSKLQVCDVVQPKSLETTTKIAQEHQRTLNLHVFTSLPSIQWYALPFVSFNVFPGITWVCWRLNTRREIPLA